MRDQEIQAKCIRKVPKAKPAPAPEPPQERELPGAAENAAEKPAPKKEPRPAPMLSMDPVPLAAAPLKKETPASAPPASARPPVPAHPPVPAPAAVPASAPQHPVRKRKAVKIICYWCQDKYWRRTPYVTLQNDDGLFLREMTGFEETLRPYMEQGYEIKHISSNLRVDYFVIFLEKELS